jgi:hypothetical protein
VGLNVVRRASSSAGIASLLDGSPTAEKGRREGCSTSMGGKLDRKPASGRLSELLGRCIIDSDDEGNGDGDADPYSKAKRAIQGAQLSFLEEGGVAGRLIYWFAMHKAA